MVLPGVVTLYIHEDEIFLVIFAEDDTSGGSSAGFGLQHFEVGLEEIIEKGAFTAVLTSNDSDSEIILLAVLEVCEYVVERLDSGIGRWVPEIFMLVDELKGLEDAF